MSFSFPSSKYLIKRRRNKWVVGGKQPGEICIESLLSSRGIVKMQEDLRVISCELIDLLTYLIIKREKLEISGCRERGREVRE